MIGVVVKQPRSPPWFVAGISPGGSNPNRDWCKCKHVSTRAASLRGMAPTPALRVSQDASEHCGWWHGELDTTDRPHSSSPSPVPGQGGLWHFPPLARLLARKMLGRQTVLLLPTGCVPHLGRPFRMAWDVINALPWLSLHRLVGSWDEGRMEFGCVHGAIGALRTADSKRGAAKVRTGAPLGAAAHPPNHWPCRPSLAPISRRFGELRRGAHW